MMPLFHDNAHSLAMVKHIIMKATQHVNSGQIPVLTVDQPLLREYSGPGQACMEKRSM